MKDNWQPREDRPYEVGYIIAYDDGRKDKFGCFPLTEPKLEAEPILILKKLVELEPSIQEASYIFSSVRLTQEYDLHPLTIEFKKNDIKNILRRFARPGIIQSGKLYGNDCCQQAS